MRTIDADAFKKYIDAQEGRPFIGCTVGEAMKILIDEQPTVQPEPQWIPVSERLPEESGWYICTCRDGVSERVTFLKWQKRLKQWEKTGTRSYWKVIAWMPLPEPYKPNNE